MKDHIIEPRMVREERETLGEKNNKMVLLLKENENYYLWC